MQRAKPILAKRMKPKLSENVSRNVNTVQSTQKVIQTHFLGYLSAY